MASIKFILRLGEKKRDRETPIYLQYIHDGQKFLLATGRKCQPRNWNDGQGKPKHDSKLEASLESFKKRFRDNAVFAITSDPTTVRVREAWADFLKREKENLPEAAIKGSIIARWQDYINFLGQTLHKGKERTQGTIRNNINSRAHLCRFLEKVSKVDLKPERFTIQDYQLFEGYLLKEAVSRFVIHNPDSKATSQKKKRGLSPNSISKVKKHFKSFLKWHIQTGGHTCFDLSLVEYAETPGLKISLSESELAAIAGHEFKGQLSLVRDLIVLQATTGVRISDLQRLCDNLNENKTAFKIKTKKTGGVVLVPVLPLAKDVLKRRGYALPYLPEQTYREGIKAIYKSLFPTKTTEIGDGDHMKKVPVWEEISSHDMIRTFVNIAWKKGISIPTIATITGKSIQVITKHYLSEDQEHAAQELLEKFHASPLRIAK